MICFLALCVANKNDKFLKRAYIFESKSSAVQNVINCLLKRIEFFFTHFKVPDNLYRQHYEEKQHILQLTQISNQFLSITGKN